MEASPPVERPSRPRAPDADGLNARVKKKASNSKVANATSGHIRTQSRNVCASSRKGNYGEFAERRSLVEDEKKEAISVSFDNSKPQAKADMTGRPNFLTAHKSSFADHASNGGEVL